jgi:hypothetical protein
MASQVMLEKGKGRYIENLRIIQLCEADLNFVLHVLWGNRLIRRACKHKALNPSQFALPGQTCNNAVLNKVLFFDLSRQTLSPGVLTDFDAKAAFDRVITGLSVATCKRVGLPIIAGHFMFHLLKHMTFHLVTGFGVSTETYSNTIEGITGQGVLQGSSSAAPIFLLNSDVSLRAYDTLGIGATFHHPISNTSVTDKAVQYVDDTSQFLNIAGAHMSGQCPMPPESPSELIALASSNSQTWASLLIMSGGDLNMEKCYSYAFRPYMDYKSNSVKYTTISSMDRIQITRSDGKGHHVIDIVPPNNARHTLGVLLSPDGNGDTQLRHSVSKGKELFGKFINSSLSQRDKWVALKSVIEPALLYPLVTTLYTASAIRPLDSITSQMSCHALGLNRTFPRAVLHGSTLLGGIGILSSSQRNSKDRVNYFLYNVRQKSTNCFKIEISIIYTQLDIGLFGQFFKSSFQTYSHLASPSFCVQIWGELEDLGLSLRPSVTSTWTPEPLCSSDQPIMHLACKVFSKKGSAMINRCRMYLQLISIADLLTSSSGIIHPAYFDGQLPLGRVSTITWPSIPRPQDCIWAYGVTFSVHMLFLLYLNRHWPMKRSFTPVFDRHTLNTQKVGTYTDQTQTL